MQRASFFSPPLIVTVLTWGFNFVAIKMACKQLTPATIALLRLFVMFGFLAAACAVQRKSFKVDRSDLLGVLGLGALSMGVYISLFQEGMNRISPAHGAILMASSPIMTYLVAVAVKQEKLVVGALAGTVVAFTGVLLIVLKGASSADDPLGGAMILMSALLWACSAVLTRHYVKKYDPLPLLTAGLPGALIVLVPLGLRDTLAVHWSSITPATWLYFVHVSLLSGALGFLGFYAGVKQIGASRAMLYQFMVPPLAALSAYIFFHQPLLFLQAIGLVLILSGVWVSQAARNRVAAAATG